MTIFDHLRDCAANGDKFGRLTVLKVDRLYATVRCDCGTEKTVRSSDLKRGMVKSCGCLRKEKSALSGKNREKYPPVKPGQRYGRLTTIDRNNASGEASWLCKCDCGGYKSVPAYYLKKGIAKSCGCMGNGGERMDVVVSGFGVQARFRTLTEAAGYLSVSPPHVGQLAKRGEPWHGWVVQKVPRSGP